MGQFGYAKGDLLEAIDRLVPGETRFLRLGIEDSIPDATTLWLFREKLAKAGLIEKLFDRFDQHLAAKGYMARGGQMVDATIVPVPKQRNSGDENEAVKAGRITGGVGQQAGQIAPEGPRRALDEEARQEFFRVQEPRECGCQAQADPALRGDRCGGPRQPEAGPALTKGNTSAEVFADSAYRSTKIEAQLRASGFKSRIHRRATRNHPLSDAQAKANRNRRKFAPASNNLGARSHDADGAHDPTTRQVSWVPNTCRQRSCLSSQGCVGWQINLRMPHSEKDQIG